MLIYPLLTASFGDWYVPAAKATFPPISNEARGVEEPIPTLPAEVMRRRSVGELAPSAVVENTSLEGFDDALHVPPSRSAAIDAPRESVESLKSIRPRLDPSAGEELPTRRASRPRPLLSPTYP